MYVSIYMSVGAGKGVVGFDYAHLYVYVCMYVCMYVLSLFFAEADIVWTASSSITRSREGQWVGTLPRLKMMDDKCGMAQLIREAYG